jgi:hypothetical protein
MKLGKNLVYLFVKNAWYSVVWEGLAYRLLLQPWSLQLGWQVLYNVAYQCKHFFLNCVKLGWRIQILTSALTTIPLLTFSMSTLFIKMRTNDNNAYFYCTGNFKYRVSFNSDFGRCYAIKPAFLLWNNFKGTVSREIRPLVFSSNNTPESTDSWSKSVSNMDSYSRRYSTTKIAHFQFILLPWVGVGKITYLALTAVTKAETLVF